MLLGLAVGALVVAVVNLALKVMGKAH